MDGKADISEIEVAPSGPKRFIRTFATDMEAIQSGANPTLTPLKKANPEQPQAVPPAAVSAPVSAPAAVTPLVPKAPAAPPTPTPTPPPPPQPAPAKTPPTPPSLPTLQTYASDFSERMKSSGASAATVLAAEQDAAPAPTAPVAESRGGVWYAVAGTVLLVAGAAGAYAAYAIYATRNEPIDLVQVVQAPIFVDEREAIEGTGTELVREMVQSLTRPLASETVRFLYQEPGAAGTSVFVALELPAPGILLRNIRTEGSMAGIVNAGGSQSAFFILSVASYGETFAGMLAWEPRMARDLEKLFPPGAPSESVATSTTPSAGAPAGSAVSFTDEIIANHDVRWYEDAEGRSVVYGYWNPTTLVIARDADAFAELMRRLATSRAQ